MPLFFDRYADILEQVTTEADGQQVASLSAVALNQPCAWWSDAGRYTDGRMGKQTDGDARTLCFAGSVTAASRGRFARFDGADWLIESAHAHVYKGRVDNVECKVSLA